MTNIRDRIEKWFEELAKIIYENKYKTLLIMTIVIAALFSQLPKITIDTSTEGFLREDDQKLIDYNMFRDQFGRDELIIVAIKTRDVFDIDFLNKLKSLHNELKEKTPYIEDINSLINARNTRGEKDRLIVEDLLEKWPQNKEDIATLKKRVYENPMYKNLVISEDGVLTTILLKTQNYSTSDEEIDALEGFEDDDFDSEKKPDKEEKKFLTDEENSKVINTVSEITKKYHENDFQIYITGSASITHFLKRSMMKDMRTFVIYALFVIIAFLYLMFRKISGTVLPVLIVILSLISTISLMAIFGTPIKMPTQILPSFILAVSVGYSVHILAIFYHHYRKNRNKEGAIIYSLGHSGLAIVMTSLTTAGGLLSFSTADIAPIVDLGIYGAGGVLLAMVYTIILLPALLAIMPIKERSGEKDDADNTLISKTLTKVGEISTGHPVKIIVISAIIIGVSIFYISKINFAHDVLRWFPEDNSIRVATEKIDAELKGTTNVEIVIDTGKENGLYDPGLLKRIEKSSKFFEKYDDGKIFVGKAWSITTILKESNQALNENRKGFYRIPDNKNLIAQELLLFENSGSDDMEDFTDSQLSKARLILKLPFVDAVKYQDFMAAAEDHFNKNYPDEKITITGMGAILVQTLLNTITTMAKSYIYALIVITVLMIILIGRIKIGFLSMIPNLTPILITLGFVGFMNIPMSLFTMLVGNIAIGLAVDDTIHFMHNFRRYFEQTGDAKFAIMETLQTAGRAMFVTTCVLSIGFFIFMFAEMNNIIQFGFLTGMTIVLALLADYFLCPALMFVINRKKEAE